MDKKNDPNMQKLNMNQLEAVSGGINYPEEKCELKPQYRKDDDSSEFEPTLTGLFPTDSELN